MATARPPSIVLTVDLESLFHAHPHYARVGSLRRREADGGFSVLATDRILDLLTRFRTTATFFVVSEIFDWYPDLIASIAAQGHEVAFHTHDHTIITESVQLEDQLARGRQFLNHYQIKGFRAPYYRLDAACLSLLQREGFHYDSSFYGFSTCFQPWPGFWEIPITHFPWSGRQAVPSLERPSSLTLTSFFRGLPLGSGLSWGIPCFPNIWTIRQCLKAGLSPVLTIHPWQFERPRFPWFLSTSFIVQRPWWWPYSRPIAARFEKVLASFPSGSIQDVFPDVF